MEHDSDAQLVDFSSTEGVSAGVPMAFQNQGEISKSGHGGARPNSGGYRPGAGRKPNKVFIERQPEGERWYCVCTDPGKDLTADIETRLAGFMVFAPTIWKKAVPPRRDAQGIVRRGLPDRIEPLFRRYFFTRFDRTDFSWTAILHLPGVRRIISSQGRPVAVPDSVIEAIQNYVGKTHKAFPNGCWYPHTEAASARMAKGTRVRLLEGAFADHIGELAEMSDGKRVKVLLQMFGAQRPVEADQPTVEVVE